MPGYLTKQERIAISGVADLHIRSLLDNQQFSDPQGLAALVGISAATWPLFGLLWPSGAELAARMGQRPVTEGERILEIGCGLGLASLVGHRRGADMTASDCHPLASLFLADNLRLNGLAPMKYRHGLWGEVAHPAPPADGDLPLPPAPGAQAAHDADHAASDGSADVSVSVSGRFDLIMGSDVLYERDDTGGLARFIEDHTLPSAEVWIVDPHRGNRPAFNRRMADLGFDLSEQRLDRLATPLHTAYRGRMLTYTRSTAS